MGSQRLIKVLITGMIFMLVWMLNQQASENQLKAEDSIASLKGQPTNWELGTGIYMNNHKYVALGTQVSNQQFLLDSDYGNDTSEWSTAKATASNLRGSNYITKQERNIVTKSDLVNHDDLSQATGENLEGQLSKYFNNTGNAWWLNDTSTNNNIKVARYVSSVGAIESDEITIDYETQEASKCVIRTYKQVGWTPMSGTWNVNFGQQSETATYSACKFTSKIKWYYAPAGTLVKTWDLSRGGCKGEPASVTTYNTKTMQPDPLAEHVNENTCPKRIEINGINADKCYVAGITTNRKSFIMYSKSFNEDYGNAGQYGNYNFSWAGQTYVGKRNCQGPLQAPKLSIRPAITLDPQSYIIAAIPTSETPDTSVSSTLTKYTQPNNEMVAGTDYKFQLFDSTQQVTSVSKPAVTQDNLFAVKDNKVQVELGTTEVTLDATVKGAHNYISAMATDKGGSTDLYGKIGTGTAATNSITLDISKIMDTGIVGEKQVNLYSEQINPNTYSDLVSSTPLTVTFEVLPPKSDQILTLDENNATEMMYGDEVTLKAYVNAEDKDLGWATAAGTDMQFALVGDDAVNHVNIVKRSFDSTTGIAEVTLKAISGEDAQVQLSVNKKGSHEQRYNDASEVLTPKITIKKREITVTPKKTILQVGDPYPPTWRFDTKMTDTNNKAAALVNGDKLPYTVSISPLEADVNEPTVDASGNVSAENMDKTWKLSVADDPGSDVVSFEKNYLVVRNDYHETKNKKSILEVAKLAYEGMEFIVQPDDVKTLVDEEYTFTAKATYPLEKGDGTPLTLEEQKVQYQWQQSLDGVTWENVTDGSVNAEYLDGVATFTFTSTKNLEVKDMQYRCIAKNLRDEADNVTAKSDPAGLQVTTEPVTFIMIPKEVEMVDKDKTIAENRKTKEADVIKLYDFDNVVSKNTETKQQVPSGVFHIYAPEKFYLTKDAVEEKQNDKRYEVTVYRSDGKKVSETSGLLMSLDYTNKQQDTFRLTTPVSRMKDVGTYIGIMTFTIKYTPSGGS